MNNVKTSVPRHSGVGLLSALPGRSTRPILAKNWWTGSCCAGRRRGGSSQVDQLPMNHLPNKLTERAALDHIKQHPRCSNSSLARVLGFSVGGVEKILRRLRTAEHIQQRGKGRAPLFRVPSGTPYSRRYFACRRTPPGRRDSPRLGGRPARDDDRGLHRGTPEFL